MFFSLFFIMFDNKRFMMNLKTWVAKLTCWTSIWYTARFSTQFAVWIRVVPRAALVCFIPWTPACTCGSSEGPRSLDNEGPKEANEYWIEFSSKLWEARSRLYRRRFHQVILVGKLSPRSTQSIPLHRALISLFFVKNCWIFFADFLQNFAKSARILLNFANSDQLFSEFSPKYECSNFKSGLLAMLRHAVSSKVQGTV